MQQDIPNWSQLITDLNKHMNLADIGLAVGLSLPAISALKNGKRNEPLAGAGIRLMNFHRQEMKRQEAITALNARLDAKNKEMKS